MASYSARAACALALSASAALILGGCSGSTSPADSGDSDGAVTLSYAIWDDNQRPAMEQIAKAFTAEHPDISVEVQVTPWDQYFTKLQTAATGRSAADVFWMNGPNFQLYASNGILAPFDAGVDTSGYPGSLIDLYSLDDELFGMPKDFDTIGVWYNKELFDAAGVDYPKAGWTWADFSSTAAQLTDPAAGVYGVAAALTGQANYYDSIAQAGGEVISADGKTSGYSSPEALAGITLWTDLIKAGSSPTIQQMTDTQPLDMFLSGKVAMLQTGSWMARGFADNAEIADKVDVAPLPEGATGNQSIIHGLANAVNAKGPHVKAAQDFAVFASSQQAAEIQAEAGAVIPAFEGTQQTWVETYPQYDLQVFIDAVDDAVPYPVSKNTSAWASIEGEVLAQVWSGAVTPEAGLKDLATKMQAALDAEQE